MSPYRIWPHLSPLGREVFIFLQGDILFLISSPRNVPFTMSEKLAQCWKKTHALKISVEYLDVISSDVDWQQEYNSVKQECIRTWMRALC